ncbi:MAG: LPS export ABC transporter periplasmic protein LptC [Muribaculaceae bacterium]|nr:LPS export ABC transporter periplasmic protein LptC [Muribaculaceae bacterium]
MGQRKPTSMMRLMPAVVASAVMAMTVVTSCSEKKQPAEPAVTDPAATPTMVTRDVETLVSDSGYTRYKITAKLWEMFEEAEKPFWRFADGIYIEKYTDSMTVEATVICDSAVYWSQNKIWELDGNVNIKNTLGDKFLTQQLFWDQEQHKVYSDSFIHIERSNRIIEGYGFKSNEQMTEYDILQPSGIFPVPDKREQDNENPVVAPEERQKVSPVEKQKVAPEEKQKVAPEERQRVSPEEKQKVAPVERQKTATVKDKNSSAQQQEIHNFKEVN